MRATTLLLPEDLRRRLRTAAQRDRTSVGELVRRTMRVALDAKEAQPAARKRAVRARDGLPTSVEDYLAAPAGTYVADSLPGLASEAEDPYANLD
jgi:plasmid stability protein